MKRGTTGVWLGLFLPLLLLLAACATPPPVSLAAPNSFAWIAQSRVPGAGRLFLLGSMHMGLGPMQLGPVLSEAFGESEVLVMEVDPDELGFLEMIRLTGRYAELPKGEMLSDHVSPETYMALLAWCERRGQSLTTLTSFRAWFAALFVEMTEYEERGYRVEYGSEEQFSKRARQQKKPIESLETAEEQMQMLASASVRSQELMLEAALEADDANFSELLSVWRSGDEAGMLELLIRDAGDPAADELLDRVVFERNANMALRLHERTVDGRDRFVLVGVAHLVGDRGIPSLLAQRGYELQRVASSEDPQR